MKTLDKMDDKTRKALPIFDGVFMYFPNAQALKASRSMEGQMQHAPAEPLQWHRAKSTDELGSITRHILDYCIAFVKRDYQGLLKATKAIAWRADAHAERFIATTNEDPEHYQIIKRMREEHQGIVDGLETPVDEREPNQTTIDAIEESCRTIKDERLDVVYGIPENDLCEKGWHIEYNATTSVND